MQYTGHFVLMISLDLMKSSEVRIAGDQPIWGQIHLHCFCKCFMNKSCVNDIFLLTFYFFVEVHFQSRNELRISYFVELAVVPSFPLLKG